MLCRQLTIYKTHFKIPRAKILAIMLPILIVIFLNRISSRLSSSYVDTSWMHHGYIMLIKVPPSCWCEQNILYVNSLKWGVVMAQLFKWSDSTPVIRGSNPSINSLSLSCFTKENRFGSIERIISLFVKFVSLSFLSYILIFCSNCAY